MKNTAPEKIVVNGIEINTKTLALLQELSSNVEIATLKNHLFHALSMIATHSERMELGYSLSDISQNIYFVYSFLEQLEESFEDQE